MLVALFFAVFAVGLLYYVVGIGQAILFRERMQAGTDAAALTGAVVHARAMNLTVLVNMLMAALLAVLVTLKLVEALAILGMLIAAGLGYVTAGASLAIVPTLKNIQGEMADLYESLRPDVFEALEVLHETQDIVQQAAPLVADGVAIADLKVHAAPPVVDGFVVGSRTTLPVEDDSFDKLCGRGGEYAAKMAMLPLEPLFDFKYASKVKDPLEKAVAALAQAMPQWFCGDGSGSPPATEQTVEKWYPSSQKERECQAHSAKNGEAGDVAVSACVEAEAEKLEAEPDQSTGECQRGHDCSLGGPYDQSVSEARVACNPETTNRPKRYVYQTREGNAEYEWSGIEWQRVAVEYEVPVLVENARQAPCGSESINPSVAVGYNTLVHPKSNVDDVQPVCTTEHAPLLLARVAVGDRQIVHFEEVSHMIACMREERERVEVSDGETAGENGADAKSPKRIESDIELGDEGFQLRAMAFGKRDTAGAKRAVELTLWERPSPDNPLDELSSLGLYSFSQAEYFYDGLEPREGWLWTMKWRARLRRFYLPEEQDDSALLYAGCVGAMGPERCLKLLGAISLVGDKTAH